MARAGKQIRFSDSETDLITRAAEKDSTNFSDFVRVGAVIRAITILDDIDEAVIFRLAAQLIRAKATAPVDEMFAQTLDMHAGDRTHFETLPAGS